MKRKYQDRVNRGIKFLDAQVPGWREKVRGKKIDMSSGVLCILGQVFMSYLRGVSILTLSQAQSVNRGFLILWDHDMIKLDQEYQLLTHEWEMQL